MQAARLPFPLPTEQAGRLRHANEYEFPARPSREMTTNTTIQSSARHRLSLINDSLAPTKIESGKVDSCHVETR